MKKYLIIIFIAFLSPQFLWAYSASLFSTNTDSINAIEGVVHIPNGANINDIQTGKSAVLIWIVPPTINKESETITFSGISPGGFQGEQPLFTLSGEFGASDLAHFTYSDVKAFKNDGTGTPAIVNLTMKESSVPNDVAPPEPFKPVIGRSPSLFNNQYFLSFVAEDKDLGVAKYQFTSSWLISWRNKWQDTSSPKELSKIELFKRLYVRAIDGAGNSRTESVNGPYYWATIAIGIIIILCILSGLLLFSKISRHRSF